jgi:cyanophycin synthetase
VILNKYLDALSIFYLSQRYLKGQWANPDRRAIRRHRSDFYARAWEDAAVQTSSTIELLGNDIFKITNGGKNVVVCQHYTPLVDASIEKLILNKVITNKLLGKINVPIPRYIHLKDLDIHTAKSFMSEIDGPVVVKPALGTAGGDGVVTNITRALDLYKALAWSRAFCRETLIEEQIKGDNYRILFLDGELLDCIIRRPPRVIGDGVSSIRSLIHQENKKRLKFGSQLAQDLIFMDLDVKTTLAAQGFSLNTKPVKGQIIKIKDVINCNRGEDNESPPEGPAESIITLGRKVSETFGVRLVGVDIITNDITVDLRESGGRVIEVNTPPGHYYHHMKNGKGCPVAVRLLQHIFKN